MEFVRRYCKVNLAQPLWRMYKKAIADAMASNFLYCLAECCGWKLGILQPSFANKRLTPIYFQKADCLFQFV